MNTPRLFGASVLGVALLAASCGGGSSATPTTVTTVATTEAPTTVADTTTIPVTSVAPTTAAPCTTFAPLTGLCQSDPAAVNRPALVVKIDNHVDALPQTGLNEADVVYEELVEGISRFAAVFQSRTSAAVGDSAPVGPIRSARSSDVDIVAALGRPLFAWSGGNPTVTGEIRGSNVVDVGYSFRSVEGGYYRDNGRQAPHNLFANTKSLFNLRQLTQGPPAPLFAYRAEGVEPVAPARDIGGVNLTFLAKDVSWKWDSATSTWLRSEAEQGTPKPHKDSAGNQINPVNVVVLFTPYGQSKASPNSPLAKTVGKGTAWVFTAGKLVEGCWNRPDRTKGAALVLCGTTTAIALTAGRTWIELPRADRATPSNAVFFDRGVDPAKVKVP
jgi:hypothetical protein